MRFFVALFLLSFFFLLSSCSEKEIELHEGYYAAEMDSFDDQGWKAFVSLYVASGKIINVEFDAKNEAGFLKSWDMDNIRWMKASKKMYPNKYMRAYSIALLNWQDPDKIHPLAGAEKYCDIFKLLAKAAMGQSRQGNKDIVKVGYPLSTTFDRQVGSHVLVQKYK